MQVEYLREESVYSLQTRNQRMKYDTREPERISTEDWLWNQSSAAW